MKKTPSPGEWQVLLALWRLDKRATADEIIRELAQKPAPSRGKIRTILSRAIEKGYVRSTLKTDRGDGPQPPGRPASRYYWPAKKREDATRAEIRRFVSVYLGDDKEATALLEEVVKEKRSGSRKKRSRKS